MGKGTIGGSRLGLRGLALVGDGEGREERGDKNGEEVRDRRYALGREEARRGVLGEIAYAHNDLILYSTCKAENEKACVLTQVLLMSIFPSKPPCAITPLQLTLNRIAHACRAHIPRRRYNRFTSYFLPLLL